MVRDNGTHHPSVRLHTTVQASARKASREATMEFRSRRDLKTTWGPAEPLNFVDSAREESKAFAVAKIYLN